MAAPQIDPESRPYWDGLAEGRLLIQRCLGCARVRFPALPGCPRCGATESEWVEAAGTGRLYSWVTVALAVTPEFAEDVPYSVATVELDEGCRMLARLEGVTEPRIDARLEVCFVEHPDWSEARFREASR